MAEDNQRAEAESVFDRAQRREREISEALKLEEERHAAAIKNMHRLRALRLERDAKASHEKSGPFHEGQGQRGTVLRAQARNRFTLS